MAFLMPAHNIIVNFYQLILIILKKTILIYNRPAFHSNISH